MGSQSADDYTTTDSTRSVKGILSQRGRTQGAFEISPTPRGKANPASFDEKSLRSTTESLLLSETEAGEKRNAVSHVDSARIEMSEILGRGFRLLFCFVGLQVSYLTWGYIQERIMTQKYGDDAFPSSLFLVFGNRVLAFTIALAVVNARNLSVFNRCTSVESRKMPNLLNFVPCSISNVLSSWAQYECLKYISFPMQVVSKSCKVIPVMLVGKFLHSKSYSVIEYMEAIAIVYGVCLFQWSEMSDKTGGRDTNSYGVALVIIYLLLDSFTSQWQSRIFKICKIDQYEMMVGVNLFSLTFTSLSLIQSGGFISSLEFLNNHPEARRDVFILSMCSAVGQMFLFYTIKHFGPIVLTIIMTWRQMFSMIMSYIRFRHPVGVFAIVGLIIVFGAIGHSIRRKIMASQTTA